MTITDTATPPNTLAHGREDWRLLGTVPIDWDDGCPEADPRPEWGVDAEEWDEAVADLAAAHWMKVDEWEALDCRVPRPERGYVWRIET